MQSLKKMFISINDLGSSILSIILSLVIIGSISIKAFYVSFPLIVIIIGFNIFLSERFAKYLAHMFTFNDKRLTLTFDILRGIKSIKIFSWQYLFLRKINNIRKEELKYLTFSKCLEAIIIILWDITPSLILLITLLTYIEEGKDIQETNIFTVLKYLSIVRFF